MSYWKLSDARVVSKMKNINERDLMAKVNDYYREPLQELLNYAKDDPDIRKMIVFDTAIFESHDEDFYGPDDELKVAIYLNNPTQQKIKDTYRKIGYKIHKLYPCMIDDDIFIDSFEPHVTSTGIKIYEQTTKISKEEFIKRVVAELKEYISSEERIYECIQQNMDWVDNDYNRYLEDPSTIHEDYWVSRLFGKLSLEV